MSGQNKAPWDQHGNKHDEKKHGDGSHPSANIKVERSTADLPVKASSEKPTVGRIVHYVMPNALGASCCAAAIVTHADESGANLGVFLDEERHGTGGFRPVQDATNDEGKSAGTWHWPERA